MKKNKYKHSLWNIPLNARKPFRDLDRDGAIDIFDCAPFNKRKKGPEHNWSRMMFIKRQRENESIEDNIHNRKFRRFEEPKESKLKKEWEEID